MTNSLITSKMQQSDIAGAVSIWVEQYKRYCGGDAAFPSEWVNNTSEIEGFLKNKVKDGLAVVVKADDNLVGYLTYDEFPFNGEKSVYCASVAHAVRDEYKEEAYLALYTSVSEDWVKRNIFNHMWTINYNDARLKSILYDLGFGSYLIDAYSCPKMLNGHSQCQVTRAGLQDVDILFKLAEESRGYYGSAPLFLKRDPYSTADISELVQNGNVFIAWDGNDAIGLINLGLAQGGNIYDLSASHFGMIDEIGAYIKPEYRGKGIGKALLKNVFDYCSSNGIKSIHVDFETANSFANTFWRKYFSPMLLSVRRTVNKNVNER